MNSKTVQCEGPTEGSFVRLPVPLGDPDAFRYGATVDILHLPVDNPERGFANRELHRVTARGLSSVDAAVDTSDNLLSAFVMRSSPS